jgi:hypothetical protein
MYPVSLSLSQASFSDLEQLMATKPHHPKIPHLFRHYLRDLANFEQKEPAQFLQEIAYMEKLIKMRSDPVAHKMLQKVKKAAIQLCGNYMNQLPNVLIRLLAENLNVKERAVFFRVNNKIKAGLESSNRNFAFLPLWRDLLDSPKYATEALCLYYLRFDFKMQSPLLTRQEKEQHLKKETFKILKDLLEANPALIGRDQIKAWVMRYIENKELSEVFSSDLMNTKEFMIELVRENGCLLKFASEGLRNDKDLVSVAIKQNPHALEFASAQLQDDKEIVLPAIVHSPQVIKFASVQLQDDRNFILQAIRLAVQQGSKKSNDLSKEFEEVLAPLQLARQIAHDAENPANNDQAVVLQAAAQNGGVLQFAAQHLLNDHQMVLAAIQQNGLALQFVPSQFNNHGIIATAIGKNSLRHVSDLLNAGLTKDQALARVKKTGRQLRSVPDVFKNDFQVVLEAVKQNGSALEFASSDLKDNEAIVFAAMKQSVKAIQFASDRIKSALYQQMLDSLR